MSPQASSRPLAGGQRIAAFHRAARRDWKQCGGRIRDRRHPAHKAGRASALFAPFRPHSPISRHIARALPYHGHKWILRGI